MIEEFIRRLYITLVEKGVKSYEEIFSSLDNNDLNDEYWKNSKIFFSSLSEKEKNIFFEIIRQIIVDSISGIFGVIDGSSSLTDGNMDCNVIINGVKSENELQDIFLEYVENLKRLLA